MTPGAYIHVPFCAHRCSYCSFVALEGREREEEYFTALLAEIAARRGEVEEPLGSVYFGGGTPSYVAPGQLGKVLDALDAAFGIAPDAEITAEGNPDDLDASRLAALASLGVNRLSVGVQSLVDSELLPLERRHDAAGALAALDRAVPLFGNVSADLMIGIPGQTRESLRASLGGLLKIGVTHLSVYLLELEKAPRLLAMKRERPELFPGDEEAIARWEEVDDRAAAAGLPRYEISNWARPGFESRHNLRYWTGVPTVGLGVAAHSWDGWARRANTSTMPEYLRRVREGGTAFISESRLPEDAAARERVLLGLRLAGGVPAVDYDAAKGTLSSSDRGRLDDREAAGLLERVDGVIRLTRAGVLLSNEVFSLLL